jgi:hypothetical protein
MGCGASSQVKGPHSHGQAEPADASATRRQEGQEPRKPDCEAHHKEEASPKKSSLLIAPAQGQSASAAASKRQEDVSEPTKPDTHPHQGLVVTGALPSATAQPTTPPDDDRSSGHDGSCAAAGTPSPGVLETLRSQMHAGFQRRNVQFLQEIFNKHKSPASDSAGDGLSKASLGQALRDLGVSLSVDELEELFYTQDLNSDGWISWSEFLMVVERPSKIHEWASTLPLAPLLADCMPSKDEADPVRGLSKLQTEDMQAISACFSEGLLQLLRSVRVRVHVCVFLRHFSCMVYIHTYIL